MAFLDAVDPDDERFVEAVRAVDELADLLDEYEQGGEPWSASR